MLPGPSKGSQPYAPKSRGNICWPKYKGPRPVLLIFKPCFGQICELHSCLGPFYSLQFSKANFIFWGSILNCLAVATAIWKICFLCVLGQSLADVLRNPSYVVCFQCAGLHFQQILPFQNSWLRTGAANIFM
jgi:hypothetical protein